ncbi:MAG: hypothetical protein RMK57_13105 [Bryobacterales bacterium]|nr:hypothetical protein [Bryobacteraceae bacterium]MDW8355455.1 hypothetical protein [Bryobacterales bacterium]
MVSPFNLYARCIVNWETRLARRDTNRIIRPFEWGLEWLEGIDDGDSPAAAVAQYVVQALRDSERFFSYRKPSDYCLDGQHLTFTSPLASPYPCNNRVHADFFPAPSDKGRAVVVLPQWNADASSHISLCRLLNRFGLTALRMSLAYHDRRMPAELQRADYHVSANIGRTIHACRQSVMDTRACLDWLEARGYTRLAVLGTSLGSCIGFIATAHDPRVRAGVFNHVSMYFGDVVWTGLSTRHVRLGLEKAVTQDELRHYWGVISPASYMDRLIGRDLKSLLIWARYDTTFLPEYSRQVVEAFRERGLDFREFRLWCGHYTTGRFPFNILDGLAMCRFLREVL